MIAPWLSVLMPIYNGAATLSKTLASLAGQQQGCEVLAVLQSSEDNSQAILEAHSKHLNLRILEAPENSNWMKNTNIALQAARAPLVTMLHQDDLWRSGRAAALRQMSDSSPSARLWLHAADYIDSDDRIVGRFAPPFGAHPTLITGQEALSHLLVQNTIALPAAMFRRDDALGSGGLDEDLWYTADWDLWLRLAGQGSIVWNPASLAAFRIHSGSQTIKGSRDADGFRRQLAMPVERHIGLLTTGQARRVRKLSKVSNELNASLAGAFHGNRSNKLGLAFRFLLLGPVGWHQFFRDTNIIGRVLPRLKLRQKA